MEWFEKKCRFGRSFRNLSAGSWCGTSNHWAGLPRPRDQLLRNPNGRILVRSLGGFVQNHRQTHARFRESRLRGFGRIALINLAGGEMLLEHPLSHVIVFGAAL